MLSNLNKKSYLLISIGLVLMFETNTSLAQKLNDVQEGNLWATAIKVDGKPTEWGQTLKANNKSTNLFYSIANDNKNLYLIIQSKDLQNNSKIMLGGITFTVNPDGKKKDKNGFNVTYPIVNRVRRQGGGARTPGQGGGGFGGFQQRTPAQRDSLQMAMAKTQLATAKDIKVFGFKDVTDSLISIYNEFGIKAAANIDESGVLTYELTIPLTLLQLSTTNPKEFSYNVKVNGFQFNFSRGSAAGGRPNGGGGGFGGGGRPNGGGNFGGGGRGGDNIDRLALMSPTDFWGKYTLASQ